MFSSDFPSAAESSSVSDSIQYPVPQVGIPLLVAHRGAPLHAPENTLASLRRAVQDGATAVEFDVRQTRDGVPVLLHDATLQRTTDGSGYLSRHDLSDLQDVDAGSWFSDDALGERVPTLVDALRALPAAVRCMIELKHGAARMRGVTTTEALHHFAARVLAVLRNEGCLGRAIITSFSSELLRAVRAAATDAEIGWLRHGSASRTHLTRELHGIGAQWCIRNVLTLSRAESRHLRQHGYRVAVFTATSRRTLSHAMSCGVDAIITNDVPFAREVLHGRSLGQTDR